VRWERCENTYRDRAAVPDDRYHGVVGLRPSRCGIDDNEDSRVVRNDEGGERHGNHDISLAKYLLQAVKRKPSELRLYQIGPVLHHDFELAMALLALPHGHQMQHVHTLCLFSLFFAPFTAQLDASDSEQRSVGAGVDHLNQARVEVDFGSERRNRNEASRADGKNRRDGL
jgi:hypothetical protein